MVDLVFKCIYLDHADLNHILNHIWSNHLYYLLIVITFSLPLFLSKNIDIHAFCHIIASIIDHKNTRESWWTTDIDHIIKKIGRQTNSEHNLIFCLFHSSNTVQSNKKWHFNLYTISYFSFYPLNTAQSNKKWYFQPHILFLHFFFLFLKNHPKQ